MIIILYLAVIVAANWSATQFGPSAVVVNSFLFIALDLTARDMLHERWHHNRLALRMSALIATGSILSALLNWDAARVAAASFIAFAAAGIVDTITYHALGQYQYHRAIKINGSNIVSATVDSFLFPTLAFGVFSLGTTSGMIAAKIIGGFVWGEILCGFTLTGYLRKRITRANTLDL